VSVFLCKWSRSIILIVHHLHKISYTLISFANKGVFFLSGFPVSLDTFFGEAKKVKNKGSIFLAVSYQLKEL